jgi:integrase
MKKSNTPADPEKKSPWEKTKFQYLIRYAPSGVYFAKFKVGKKQFRFSLETTVISVAQARLTEKMKEKRATVPAKNLGRMLVKEAIEIHQHRYNDEVLIMLRKTWPGIDELEVARITAAQCREWGAKLAKTFAPTRFNATVAALRHIFEISVKAGARHNNPALEIKRMRVRAKKLTLPTKEQFAKFAEELAKAGGRFSQHCADFVSFLAFTGMRKGEAATVTWKDVNTAKGYITVRGDAITGTKNWEVRRVPITPPAKDLLAKMREKREKEKDEEKVLKVQEAQKAMDRAAKKVGMERITHHDLRHFFATICIESGVDVPTVSRWLGHKDGGALAMKTYGHLRDEHSFTQAQRVSF